MDGHTHEPITLPSDAHTYLVVEPLRLRVPRHVNQRPLEPREGELLRRLLLSRLLLWLPPWLRSRGGLRLAVLLQRGGGPRLEASGERASLFAGGRCVRSGGGRGQGPLGGLGRRHAFCSRLS